MIKKRGIYWQFRFEIASVNGKRKWCSKSGFKTKKEAMEAGLSAQVEYNNTGNIFKPNIQSYSDYLDYWFNDYCKNNLKYNTRQAYKSIINLYIKPKLGKYRLCSIDSNTLNTFINSICNENNYSRNYYRNIIKVIKGSFRDACFRYNYLKNNPSVGLTVPRCNDISFEFTSHIYTNDEVNLILNRLKNNIPFLVAFMTARLIGLRTSELFALTWDDIDFNNNVIRIHHSIYDKPKDKKGRWYINSPKTISSYREIPIGNWLGNLLKSYRIWQQKLKQLFGSDYIFYHYENDIIGKNKELKSGRIVRSYSELDNINLVFTKPNGKYVGTDLIKYPYLAIRKELNIDARFYDNRATFATILSEAGVNIRGLQRILGHIGDNTIEKYYINSTEDIKRDIINKAEDIFITDMMMEIKESIDLKVVKEPSF